MEHKHTPPHTHTYKNKQKQTNNVKLKVCHHTDKMNEMTALLVFCECAIPTQINKMSTFDHQMTQQWAKIWVLVDVQMAQSCILKSTFGDPAYPITSIK